MHSAGSIVEINGPLVTARLPNAFTGEQVSIGELALTGEVLGRRGENAILQVYESTEGLRPGDGVQPLGHPLSVELGPGLLGRIFDGVGRVIDDGPPVPAHRSLRCLQAATRPTKPPW